MKNENSRNTIIFIVCSVLILGIYWLTVLRPQAERRAVIQQAQAEQKTQTDINAGQTSQSPAGSTYVADRGQALATAARVPIQSGTLKGSLSLQGARIDDLFLTDYKETQDKPEPVELFRPQGMQNAYFAQFGWTGPNV
ncbi:membrane protein insertase YidC, partial [Brevundimonas nasdae]|uniref:membrane protein insertase YidC n=1 Tax=Brevundimonas nasdae TaxID=172043 RepID=UPI0028A0BAE0